jgi:hypothetical protein
LNNTFGRIDNRPSIFGSSLSGSTDFGSSFKMAQNIFKSSSFVSSGLSQVTFDKFDQLSERDDLESIEEDGNSNYDAEPEIERNSHAVPISSEPGFLGEMAKEFKSPAKTNQESGSSSGSATKNNIRLVTREERDQMQTQDENEESPFAASNVNHFY